MRIKTHSQNGNPVFINQKATSFPVFQVEGIILERFWIWTYKITSEIQNLKYK